MFSKLSLLIPAALISLAAASPWGTPPPPVVPPTSNQCCTSVQDANSAAALVAAVAAGLDLTGITVPVGLGCSPITVIGNNCGGTTVVCDAPESAWGTLIAINCIPITL
ncbi:hydrophobin [Mycena polygramma]|nr:hydrophobin [Mycena polygramma]